MLITLLALCLPAQAHPHVWVTVETTLLYEGGAFTGLRHKWTFDEFYSAMAIEGLDTNKDGKYDREELAELAKVNVTSLKDFGYFTHPMLAGTPVKIADPRDYWLEHTDGILSLHFTVPFATPVLPEAKGLSFSVSDPSFFIAFALAKTAQPVRLSEGAPRGCSLKNGGPEEAREVSALGESLAAVGGFAISGATTISVECVDEPPPPPTDPTGLLATMFILGPDAVPPFALPSPMEQQIFAAIFGRDTTSTSFALRPPKETLQQIFAAILGPDVIPPTNSFRRPEAARKTILASIMGPELVPFGLQLRQARLGPNPRINPPRGPTILASIFAPDLVPFGMELQEPRSGPNPRINYPPPRKPKATTATRTKGKPKLAGRRGRAKLTGKSRCRSCAPGKRTRLVRIPGRQ